MSKRFSATRSKTFALAAAAALLVSAGIGGCSSGGYDKPEATETAPIAGQTQNVLIDVATLQGWIDQGLVNNDSRFEKVVILDATEAAKYGAGHIPGAQLWDVSEQVMDRVEGPVTSVNMVLDGASMDRMLQKHGIDDRTTVVITSSMADSYYPGRTYFLFRYWGFPKERLKVLNGFNGAWTSAGKAMVTDVPAATPSSFSVKQLAAFRPELRASLDEVITAVKGQSAVPVDMRGDKSAAASTPGVFSDVAGDFVVFEGRLKGGKAFVWKNFSVNYDGVDINGDTVADPKDLTFKDAATIAAALNTAGVDGTRPIISYCRTGYIASAGFLVLDGILGWPVMTYDGSWSQWGSLSTAATGKGGQLAAGSKWATDTAELMEVINYNVDAGRTAEATKVNAQAQALHPDPALPDANNIENDDAVYRQQSSGGAPGATTPGGGGC